MVKDYEITTCGLSCDLCDANTTKIQESAKYLAEILEDPMFRGVISLTNQDFKEDNYPILREMLDALGKFPPCPGCEGRNDCVINQCAAEKEIENCSQCSKLDLKKGLCTAPPTSPKVPMMPSAPIFFNGLSKRYKNWNIKHLSSLSQGEKDKVNQEIQDLIDKGKTNREKIDFSVNLFEMNK